MVRSALDSWRKEIMRTISFSNSPVDHCTSETTHNGAVLSVEALDRDARAPDGDRSSEALAGGDHRIPEHPRERVELGSRTVPARAVRQHGEHPETFEPEPGQEPPRYSQ
jgi:hypothetical protein